MTDKDYRIEVELRNGFALKIFLAIEIFVFFVFGVYTKFSIFYKPSVLTVFVIALFIAVFYLGYLNFKVVLTLDFSLSKPRLTFAGKSSKSILVWPFSYKRGSENRVYMKRAVSHVHFAVFSRNSFVFKIVSKVLLEELDSDLQQKINPSILDSLYVVGNNEYRLNELFSKIEDWKTNELNVKKTNITPSKIEHNAEEEFYESPFVEDE